MTDPQTERILQDIAIQPWPQAPLNLSPDLSDEAREVLRLARKGISRPEIRARLNLSEEAEGAIWATLARIGSARRVLAEGLRRNNLAADGPHSHVDRTTRGAANMNVLPSDKKKEAREREEAFEAAFADALAKAIERDPRYEGDLAFLLGLEAPSFSRYKNGRVTPSLGKAMLMAAFLGFSIDALVREGPEEAPTTLG